MKKLDDPIEIQKYISGQKGKTFQVSFDPQSGPNFKPEDIETLENIYGKMYE